MKELVSYLTEWRRAHPRASYAIAATSGILLLGVVLWAAGAFSGGGEDSGGVSCEVAGSCPSASPTPAGTLTSTPTPSVKPSATGTATPTPLTSATPTSTPVAAPTATATKTPVTTKTPVPTPTPITYGLALAVGQANFERMVDFALVPGKPDEALVSTQKERKVWHVSISGGFQRTVYGDLSSLAGGSGNEEGLLSVALSPSFQSDKRVYVYYTQGGASNLPTVLSRFDVVAGKMDTANETRILEVPDFANNHNGGRILFGPDGYLYLSLGDGGGGGDPNENGQDKNTLLGKILRLKVTGEPTYTSPPGNPFVGAPGRDEIWAYGFRNPWRFSFDRSGGALWVGDVGQSKWEEVESVVKGGNYGWDCYEGFVSYEPAGCGAKSTFKFPRAVYDHADGSCSVTGGYVYRGSAMPELKGRYIYGDFCSGKIWAVNPATSNNPVLLLDSNASLSSFAELPNGELLVITFNRAIYKLAHG